MASDRLASGAYASLGPSAAAHAKPGELWVYVLDASDGATLAEDYGGGSRWHFQLQAARALSRATVELASVGLPTSTAHHDDDEDQEQFFRVSAFFLFLFFFFVVGI